MKLKVVRKTKIAVDFDGTIVKHRYPEIGDELPLAIDTLKSLQAQGCKLYLNTMRGDGELKEAVDWCASKGLVFDSIGPHPSQRNWTSSTKLYAHLYIDDANVGTPIKIDEIGRPYVDWERLILVIEQRISLL